MISTEPAEKHGYWSKFKDNANFFFFSFLSLNTMKQNRRALLRRSCDALVRKATVTAEMMLASDNKTA